MPFSIHERMNVPALAPGEIVVMDNLGNHKGAGAQVIEAAGATLLYLPPAVPTSGR
jgi:transposase